MYKVKKNTLTLSPRYTLQLYSFPDVLFTRKKQLTHFPIFSMVLTQKSEKTAPPPPSPELNFLFYAFLRNGWTSCSLGQNHPPPPLQLLELFCVFSLLAPFLPLPIFEN